MHDMTKSCFAAALMTLAAALPAHAQAGWMADRQSGCRVWNPNPEPDEHIEWKGPCAEGFAEGKGTLRWFSKGKPYETDEGEFRKGKLNGFATLTWSNGRHFEGLWRDQKPNGKGTLTLPNGEVFSGDWQNGCFTQGSRHATQNASARDCQSY
jgi:hypothetical protein